MGYIAHAIQTCEGIQQLAEVMAKCGSMPLHLKDKPQDCFRIVVQAAKWKMDPFAVAECTSLVHGRLCYEGKLVVAVLRAMNAIDGRLTYDFTGSGQDMGITVTGTPTGGGRAESLTGSVKQWRTRQYKENKEIPNNWDKDPQSQLVYRGSRQWARLFAPEALLGIYTPDEMDDVRQVEHEVRPPDAARTGEPVERQGVVMTETKSTEVKTTPKTQHPALASANKLWAELEAKGKGKGKAVISRLSALYGVEFAKDLPADDLDAFGKDINELAKNVQDEPAMEDILGRWEHDAKDLLQVAGNEGATK
jgi:hypothetical protein